MHRHRLTAPVAALEDDATLAAVACHVRLFPRAALSPYRRDYEKWLRARRSVDTTGFEHHGASFRGILRLYEQTAPRDGPT